MKAIKADVCRVCGKVEARRFYVLPRYPLTAGSVTSANVKVPLCDIVLGYCFNCGTSTIVNKVADGIEYGDGYVGSDIGYGKSSSVDRATEQFLDFVGDTGIGADSKVLEIGSYDGSFMAMLNKKYGCEMVGCEPCAEVAKTAIERGFGVWVGDFSADTFKGFDFDLVVMRNVLEHVLEPYKFLADVKKALKPNGRVVLEVSAGEYRIMEGILGSVVPEHPCYFGFDSLYNLLDSLFESPLVQYDRGILRAMARKPWKDTPERSLDAQSSKVMRTYSRMRHGEAASQKRRADFYDLAHNVNNLYVYGANTCTLELLAGGCIRYDYLASVYDDDPRKWGKYLVNSGIRVSPSSELKELAEGATVLVSSYRHMDSIMERLASSVVRPFAVIKLYPHVEVVRYE